MRGWSRRGGLEGREGLTPGSRIPSLPAMESFTGLKVFSSTKAGEREVLGEVITKWISENPGLEIVARECRQSSDDEFHCLTITLFFRPKSK